MGEGEPVPLYPLFLKLDGAPCLVVGAGKMGAHKARELAACGAVVRLVGPSPSDEARAVAADSTLPGRVEVLERAFVRSDVEGARIVIAATDDEAVNTAVVEAARAEKALVNVVDVVPLCDFYTGGVVRRGPLTVVVGTSGASPSLARRVRLLLEEVLPAGLGPLGAALGRARPRLLERYPSFKARAALLDAFVARAVARVQGGDAASDAEVWVTSELLPESGPRLVRLSVTLNEDGEGGDVGEVILADDTFAAGRVRVDQLPREEKAFLLERTRVLLKALTGQSQGAGPHVVERANGAWVVDGARVDVVADEALVGKAAASVVEATYALVLLE